MRISRRLLLALPLPLLALVGGCFIVSGQITIVHNFGSGDANADETVYDFSIDLNEIEDYREHKDKLKSVEAAGFEVEVTNLSATQQATAEGYLSVEDLGSPSVDQVKGQGTRIFSAAGNPVEPQGTRVIDFEESQQYLENFGDLEHAVKQGIFHVYIIAAEGTSVRYEDLTLVVTINVEY